ncbi:hypothetical protein [Bdellovibrio sp. HCB288]|uniref:hypothetical protein n=1 Tax=Bdellovibrio sp. HCB288 TaxID=3394355 RepID=UPI0039B42E8B
MKTLILASLFVLGSITTFAAPRTSTEVKPGDPTYEHDDQFGTKPTRSSSSQEINRDRRATSDPRIDESLKAPQGTRDMKDSDGSIKEHQ